MPRLARLLPPWVPGYQRAWLSADALAGLTVWALLVPEGLAYASLAGVPPETGLYATIPALVLYALVGSSRQLVMGPSSSTALLSLVAITPIAAQQSPKFIALSAALALLVGAIALAARLLRLGWISNFMAEPVLLGFIAGLALTVIAGQIPKMLGIDIDHEDFIPTVIDTVRHLGETDLTTLAVGGGSLVLVLTLKRTAPRLPAALITVAAGTLVVVVFGLQDHGVEVVGDLRAGLPTPHLPDVDLHDFSTLAADAAGIFLVGLAEGLSTARTYAARHHQPIDPNREVLGLSVANLGSGLVGGFAVNGSLSKTAVDDEAGGRSPLTGVAGAGLVVLTLLFLTPLFAKLPLATLAAVIVAALIHLIQVARVRRLYYLQSTHLRGLALARRPDFAVANLALVGVLVLGPLPGLGVGVGLSLLSLVYRVSHPGMPVLAWDAKEHEYVDVARDPHAAPSPGVIVVRIEGPVLFVNAQRISDRIRELYTHADPPVKAIVADVEPVSYIDATAATALADLDRELSRAGITLVLARPTGVLQDLLAQSEVATLLREGCVFPTVHEAVDEARLIAAGTPTPKAPRAGIAPPPAVI